MFATLTIQDKVKKQNKAVPLRHAGDKGGESIAPTYS
jgi:hypothetical protein